MYNEVMRNEMREAITAGERALSSLRCVQEKLNSAGNWGLLDMFGGGTISSIIKHSKMNVARRLMEEAKRDLLYFQSELKDVNVWMDIRLEVGDFLTIADFFFDGFVADYLVQTKISEAKRQISIVIGRVEQILADLQKRM